MGTMIRVLILCGVALVACARPADACTCAMRPVSVAFWDADLVFVGQAHVIPLGRGAQRARFRVEEMFRGPSRRVVDIVARGIGGSCAYAFTHGTRYLVFASRQPDGTYAAFYCNPTAPVDEAAEAIRFARNPRRAPPVRR
jgi:hypothetical protein